MEDSGEMNAWEVWLVVGRREEEMKGVNGYIYSRPHS